MSCDISNFTITQNQDNEFIFTIKADGSTLPMVIEVSDTFVADLINLETLAIVDEARSLTISDAANGKIKLTYTESVLNTLNLESKRGSEVDKYYPKPTYKIHIKCVTTNNGDFIAKVPEVYVD